MAVFGIERWEDRGWIRTRRGPRRLLAARTTPRFEAAWWHCRALLDAVGFEGSGGESVKLWLAPDHDEDLAALACAEAEAYVPIGERMSRERAARREAEARAARDREAAQREAEREAIRQHPARVRAALLDLVENRPWLLQAPQLARAEELLAEEPFAHVLAAEDLLKLAARTERRARDRASALIEPVAGDRLDAIHDALRLVSSCDVDRARQANGIGWGKATSTTGHWLSSQESLTPEQAAHGLKLLRTHRRQLPRDVRISLGL